MAYELVIGTKNWSSWSLRAWLALRCPEVPFKESLIALRQADSAKRIQAVSPSARVPLLCIAEGARQSLVFDSLAICETIAERHPEAGLWPDDPIARSLARSYAAEMHAGFLAFREALPMDFARELPAPPVDETVRGQIDRIQTAWALALGQYGEQGGFLFGRFSIADCMYAPVVSRFITYGIAMPDAIARYSAKMMSLPAMQEWRAGAQQEIENGLPDQWKVDMVRNAR